MKNSVLVEPAGVEGDEQLAGWIQRAVKFGGAAGEVTGRANSGARRFGNRIRLNEDVEADKAT
jgi:hypothetical protein